MKFAVVAVAAFLGFPAFAGDISVAEGYALVSRPNAPAGAVFMVLKNTGDTADTLIAASSPVATRAELHTHIKEGDVMRMREIEGGIEVAADSEHALARGGDHVMLMGLNQSLDVGAEIEVTLTFENAGDMLITVPVKDGKAQHDHGEGHKHNH